MKAAVDYHGLFLDAYIGWPGKHDKFLKLFL